MRVTFILVLLFLVGCSPLVEISTDPTGATIMVDGEVVGEAPISLRIEEGIHRFSASMEDHKESSMDVNVTKRNIVILTLAKTSEIPKVGHIQVITNPPGAALYVDGNYAGDSPMNFSNLPAQKYVQFRASKEGYVDLEFRKLVYANTLNNAIVSLETE